ncbi:MAG: hypothetical protein JKY89_02775 [Immundisolibacteraceae bacterium]|nr:hypothetical protein [Immundisolibacteraceae bacterium]
MFRPTQIIRYSLSVFSTEAWSCRGIAIRMAAILVSLSAVQVSFAGTVYRWTDEEGQRHMESIIPADDAKLGYEVLDDRSFRVLKKVNRALTEDELVAADATREIERKKQLVIEASARHDRTLLATYMSVDGMEMARNGQINTLNSIIESTERTRERLKSNLDDLIGSAASYERDSRKVPVSTVKDIEAVRAQILSQDKIIEENYIKQSTIIAQFTDDIARFKELKGLVDQAEVVPLKLPQN